MSDCRLCKHFGFAYNPDYCKRCKPNYSKFVPKDELLEHDKQIRADAECEYISKVFERLKEVDADYISIDHLIEVLEWAKEQLEENSNGRD